MVVCPVEEEKNDSLIINNDKKGIKIIEWFWTTSLLTCTYCKYSVSPLDYVLHVLYIHTTHAVMQNTIKISAEKAQM